MKRVILFCAVAILLFAACGQMARPTEAKTMPYGVFLGRNGNETDGLTAYRTVVVEPEEYSAEQIAVLHAAGCTVYGYLNIGAVETYRAYFGRFEYLSLGVYEDWPDERWIDVSDADWQAFLTQELALQYTTLGIDGFFLDNTDVYYHYETEEMFDGLCTILRGLRAVNPKLTLLINGGDAFVSRCIAEGIANELFDGVNQETVFTSIDFDTETFHPQNAKETAYFQEYLQTVKQAGLQVYLLEYDADDALSQIIDAYCKENGFAWYNAKDLDLT